MKGNKKVLALAILLLLVLTSFGTYAIYSSSASGSGTVETAAWVVEVNGTDIVENNSFTLGNVTWTTPTKGKNGKIAPGDTGTVTIVIDADGSEVDVDYTVALGTITGGNNNFTVTAASGSSLTGTIPYSATSGGMEHTVTLDVVWTATDDDTTANPADVSIEGSTITIPVTVTAKQHLGN